MRRNPSRAALALLLAFTLTFIIIPTKSVFAADTTFTIAWITDTQFLSASSPDDFDTLTNWIVDNAKNLNLMAVVHTGDVVDSPFDKTQWANAARSIESLLRNNISYCWCAGNHDLYFPQAYSAFDIGTLRTRPYWVSNYNLGMNTAISFNFSSQEFLIIGIEYDAGSSVFQWANTLINNNPSALVIIGTHAYLDPEFGITSWGDSFQSSVVDTHPNVFLTLNGHFHPVGITASRARSGSCDSLFFNMQGSGYPRGAATVRLLTFDMAQGTINVTTYNTYQSSYMADSENQFILAPSVLVPKFNYWVILPFVITATILILWFFGRKSFLKA